MVATAVWNIAAECYEIGGNTEDGIMSHDGDNWVYADTRQPVVSEWFDELQINFIGGPRDGDMVA